MARGPLIWVILISGEVLCSFLWCLSCTVDGAVGDLAARERTLAMVKPDGVEANHTEAIKSIIKVAGFDIVMEKNAQLDPMTAQMLYREHFRKPFFQDLIKFITSGPVVVMVLEQENAVVNWRKLMGPTDPVKARIEQPDSIRALYGSSTTQNCVHGSDSPAAANREILIIFQDVQAGNMETRNEEL